MGYFPVKPQDMPYDEEYFDRYRERADSEIGRALTSARCHFVARHYSGVVLDVGIGCGQFVEARPKTFGFDVNPAGIDWLNARGLFMDLYATKVPAATFWDSLEHIPEPAAAIAQVEKWAFVSIPLFQGAEHCLRSKHFRREEHIWYFEDRGIRAWFAAQGFECVESNDEESRLGREDIRSYAFRRVGHE